MTFCYNWRTKKVHTHRGWSLRGPPNNYLPFSRYTYWSTDWVLSVPEFRLTFYQLNANSMSKFISQCPRPPPCCYLWAADSCLCCVMVFKVPVVHCTWTSAVGAGDWCGHTIMLLVWRSHQYPWPVTTPPCWSHCCWCWGPGQEEVRTPTPTLTCHWVRTSASAEDTPATWGRSSLKTQCRFMFFKL